MNCPEYRDVLTSILVELKNSPSLDKIELYLDLTVDCCRDCKGAIYRAVFQLDEGRIRYELSPKRDLRDRLYHCPIKEKEDDIKYQESRRNSQIDRRNRRPTEQS